MIPRDASGSRRQEQPLVIGHAMILRRVKTSRDHRNWKTSSDPSRALSKRLMDISVAAFVLLSLAPLFIAIATIIKVTSPGPVLVRQRRYGHRNRRFLLYTFRTAHVHDTDSTQPMPIGQLLRRTRLDHLPQFLNVLKGDMSLVGPRPHAPGMRSGDILYEHLVPYYLQRHAVRPGMTGLAQVYGCQETAREVDAVISRIDLDLEYIERWSPSLDIRILWRTARREFRSDGGQLESNTRVLAPRPRFLRRSIRR
jgi:lipopolysaccharide/colanic/teichoic acid biosynthesis glycosyltransferase